MVSSFFGLFFIFCFLLVFLKIFYSGLLIFAHVFLITLGKGKLFAFDQCALAFCVISACTNDFLLFFFFPAFPFFFLLPSHFPYVILLSLHFLLHFFAYCSSPCLFSCSNSPGCSKDYHWACACPPAGCPAHPYAGRPYHNAFDQTDTDRCHAKRNSSPDCCNSSSGARSWFDLHTL